MKKTPWLAAVSGAIALSSLSAFGTEYYVATDGSDDNDGLSAGKPFLTIDKAIATAGGSDVIHVAPGSYATVTQYGPNLTAKLVGTGESRGDVVIESAGNYRTLRMAANSWLENVTVVGNGDISKTDKGGAIEMSGGMVTNCVIRDGTAYGNNSKNAGGNLYVNANAALVVDCEISGGFVKNRGGNVCLDHGTLRHCTITGGTAVDGTENFGGNVFIYQGRVEDCIISGGSSERAGNVYIYDASSVVTNCTISGGTASNHGGNVFQRNGSIQGCVVENGSAEAANGGNIHIQAGSVIGSTVTGGKAKQNGGNIYMTGGTVSDSTISEGKASGTSWDQGGGNVFANPGRLTRCVVTGGSLESNNQGGGIRSRNAGTVIEDCLVYRNANGGLCLEGKGSHFNNTVVSNEAYGVWGYGSNPGIFRNCIVYGNYNANGNAAEWSGNRPAAADLSNCAFGTDYLVNSSFPITGWSDCIQITDSVFEDPANDDWRIKEFSILVDAGTTDTRDNASTTDLVGNPRISGKTGIVDIGCYEVQYQGMTVSLRLATALDHLYAPATAQFEATTEHAPGAVSYTWNFGDGTEEETSDEASVEHAFANPGTYSITVTAVSGSEEASMTADNYIVLVSQTLYVTAGNDANAAFPYNTPASGYPTLAAAVAGAVDGCEILVGDGTYSQTASIAVEKVLTIRGNEANPEAVVLRNTASATSSSAAHRVMSVNNASAWVSGLTMENGEIYNECGGNLLMQNGVVSNCVIRGGTVHSAWWGMGGGVRFNAGLITHCVISNNVVDGTATGDWQHGSAVAFLYGSSGRLSNCLVAYNRYVPTEGTESHGTAGLVFNGNTGSALVENCTVVGNRVEGKCVTAGAGIKCDWNTRIHNTVVALNYTTQQVIGEGEYEGQYSSIAIVEGHDSVDTCVTDDSAPVNENCLASRPEKLFLNPTAGDFRPLASGELYNTGMETTILASVDLTGKPRVMFNRIDIGCYECQSQAATLVLFK